MQPLQPRSGKEARHSVATVSTLSLINEAYSRLRASAAAYLSATEHDELCAIKAWMESFGSRLAGMADALQDEGARARKSLEQSAARLYDKSVCANPESLLAAAEVNQRALVTAYELITERLDMDAELYDLVTEQFEELSEAAVDIGELRREYETYGSTTVG